MKITQPSRQDSGLGTTDWDAFFEQPPNGVIPLVSTAKSATALKQCSVLVVESLFTRDVDAPKREAFLGILSNVIPDPNAEPHVVETSKAQLVEIFHHIKDDRKARAKSYEQEKARELVDTRERRDVDMSFESADLDFDADENWDDVFGDTGASALGDDPLAGMDSQADLTSLDTDEEAGTEIGTTGAPPVQATSPASEAPVQDQAPQKDAPAIDTSNLSLDDLIESDDSDREFCEQLWLVVKEKLESFGLRTSPKGVESLCSPPPFLFSSDFTEHFGKVVIEEIAPEVARQVGSIARSASMIDDPDERAAKIRESLNEPKNMSALWSAWQSAWDIKTRQQKEPPPPSQPLQKKKKGGLGLLDKLQKGKKNEAEEAMSQWQERRKKLRANNKKAKKIWARITAESETYMAPEDKDNTFLMELFAHDPAGLETEVKALHQIVSQSDEVGRAYDTYRRGRHMDIPLLVTAFRYPDLFIKGQEKAIKAMLRGYRKTELPKLMPFTARFLADHLK